MEDRAAIEDQKVIQNGTLGDGRDQIYQTTAQRNIEHQIGDAHVPVLITETLKATAQILQESHSLGDLLLIFYQLFMEKSITEL